MLRSPPSTRRSQAGAYITFAIAGLCAVLFPSPSVSETSGNAMTAVWVVFLVVGGLVSAVGRVSNRWAGEFVGIPLLAGAFGVYVIALAYTTIATGRLTGLTAAAALTAILFLCAARWFEVNLIRIESVKSGKIERGQEPDDRPQGGR